MKRSDDGYLAQTYQEVLLPKQLFMDDSQARFLSRFSIRSPSEALDQGEHGALFDLTSFNTFLTSIAGYVADATTTHSSSSKRLADPSLVGGLHQLRSRGPRDGAK